MLKNMLLASAAAFVVLGSAASLTNMKAVITSGNGADAALTRDATDFNAQLRELRSEQVRQATLLSVQDTTIRRLQRDLAQAEKIGVSGNGEMHAAADEEWSIGLDMPSAERAERAAEYHAAWLQAITLEDDLAVAQKAYRDLESNTGARLAALEQQTADRIAAFEKQSADKVATLARDHRFTVERLEAEIEQRDSSIVGLMHRIVSMQSGSAAAPLAAPTTVAAVRPQPQPAPAPAPTMAKAPAAKVAPAMPAATAPSADRQPVAKQAAETPTAAHGTLADGVAAYHAGDYHKAFEIWRVLANEGDTNARFHLGALYYEGRGVERQLETAQVLLSMAAAAGHEGAAAMRDKVAAELAREQVARAPGVAAK